MHEGGDHIGSAVRVANRASDRFARALDIRSIRIEHAHTRVGVRHDAGQWLVDLVRDRSRQRPERRDSGYA